MYIRCWGSRGSIPVSGSEYVRYGGDTTCMEVRSSSGDIVVVDAGSGIRCLGEKLAKEKAEELHMLFTHAHADHIMGFPFFAPLYVKGTRIHVRGCPFGRDSYHDILRGIMCDPYCPVDIDDTEKVVAELDYAKVCSEPFTIGSMTISPIKLSHPNGGLGYRFEEEGKAFVFLTDNELDYLHPEGLSVVDYTEFCRNADLLIHDAEYTSDDYSRTWGHSVFSSAVQLGLSAGAKSLGLYHVNQRRTDDEVDAMVAESRSLVEKAGSNMECFAVSNTWETTL